MATAEVLAEDEITVSNLAEIFKRAFFKTSLNEHGELVVQTDGPKVIVAVDQDNNLLKFMSVFGFKESARLELKHAFVNKMNDEIILDRFSIPKGQPDVLLADYYLPYEEGIPAFQIVSTIRLFARVAMGAVHRCDENDLVE